MDRPTNPVHPFIRTVTGDIPAGALGVCLAHEHLLGRPPAHLAQPDLILDDREMAREELLTYRQAGGRALVEMTTPDYGRDPRGLRWLATETGIHIVAATGHNKETFSRPFLQGRTVDELAERFVHEVTVGMDDTDIPAGVLKASSTLDAISPLAETLFRAVAQAHRRTGAPISTHTEAGTMALEQVALLAQEGVDPTHVVIGHLDRKLDWDYHLAVARTGAFLGFDQIGKEKYAPDALRARFILDLFQAGHGHQILLSGDMARRSYWSTYSNGKALGFRHILERFCPLLQRMGLEPQGIHMLLVDNPARAFAFRNPG